MEKLLTGQITRNNEDSIMQAKTVIFENNKLYTLDKYGFLNPPDQWDDVFAKGMAEIQGIYGGLTQEHWDFIFYLRKKFVEEKTVPVLVSACAENKLRLKDFKFLFPTGYYRGACRIAGINYDFIYKTNYWITYETTSVLKADYTITPLGFLEDFEQWDERFAHIVMREWKLQTGLTEKHWTIIKFLRNYYKVENNIPTVFEVCKKAEIDLDEFLELFPEGYRRGACRISGLPFFP